MSVSSLSTSMSSTMFFCAFVYFFQSPLNGGGSSKNSSCTTACFASRFSSRKNGGGQGGPGGGPTPFGSYPAFNSNILPQFFGTRALQVVISGKSSSACAWSGSPLAHTLRSTCIPVPQRVERARNIPHFYGGRNSMRERM